MHRLLKQLDDVDLGRARYMRPGGRDLGRRLLGVLVALVLVAAGGAVFAHKQWGLTLTTHGIQRPGPLGTPPVVPAGLGSVRYMKIDPATGEPVSYDPCRPIHYVVNDTLAPPGGDDAVRRAVQEVSADTGLAFEYDGHSDDLPTPGPQALLGNETKPVLIAWTTPQVAPKLAGNVAGFGGSAAVTDDYTGRMHYVTGQVVLDAPDLTDVMARPTGPAEVQAIVMHELGHLVGLAHVDDPHELMDGKNVGRLSFGPGDREGLAKLGSGACFH